MTPHYGEGGEEALKRLDRKILKRWGENALDRPETYSHRGRVAPDQQVELLARRNRLMKELKFDGMDVRRSIIKRAWTNTCAWVLTHPTYKAWRRDDTTQSHNGFLWVRGKPGAGKSVLMKHLHNSVLRDRRRRDICLSFYFNARGGPLEKSLVGMYRSMLTQLLSAEPGLQVVLDDAQEITVENEAAVHELQRIFRAAVSMLKDNHLFCFIDALDECREHDVQQMIYFFQDLGDEAIEDDIVLSVCFASRHYPTLDIPTELQINLEHTRDHESDLRQYVQGQRFSIGLGGLANIPAPVQETILGKANGVFLWAVLVIEMLKREYTRGFMPAVEQRLSEVPGDLMALFREMVQRDRHDIREFSLCLKWLLYSERPLKLHEFYFAMMAGLGDHCLRQHEDLSDNYMHSYLLSSSKGLAEVACDSWGGSIVQFIHESVQDFLIDRHGLEHIDPQNFTAGHAHELLKECCHRMLQTPLSDPTEQPEWVDGSRSEISEFYPFLYYAAKYILVHADTAFRLQSVAQGQFLADFDVLNWSQKATLVGIDMHLPKRLPTIFCICAWKDYDALVTCLAEDSAYSEHSEYAPYDDPLMVAFSCRSQRALRILLQREAAANTEAIIRELGDAAPSGLYSPNLYSTEFLERLVMAPLAHERRLWHHRAISFDYPAFSLHCLRVYAGELDSCSVTSFIKAAAKGFQDTVTLFLDKGISVNAERAPLNRALEAASHGGAMAIVELLLEQGADPNARGGREYRTALQAAQCAGQEAIAALLVKNGARAPKYG
jgi:hypothetical protein